MGNKKTLIILTGGGSGGPVTPLLALYPDLQQQGYDIAWVGTKNGLEKGMVEQAGISYYGIVAGKFRRYFSFKNLIDPFKIFIAFFQSLSLLSHLRPSLVMTAGGFVSVPVVWAAWALRIKVIVHQQDIRPGLANRLMAPCADVITVTFEKSLEDFGSKAVWTGNPVREEFMGVKSEKLKVESKRKKLLVLGGGIGSVAINELIHNALPELIKICDVAHVTGKNFESHDKLDGYRQYEFLDAARMAEEMMMADVVVTRAGLSTLTELSYLGKPAVIIPMPDSHQEDNAEYFKEREAAIIIEQKALTVELFVHTIDEGLRNEAEREQLSRNISGIMAANGNERLARWMKKLLDESIDSPV